MDFKTYQAEALITESRPGQVLCNPQLVLLVMQLSAAVAVLSEQAKKAAFYGKPIDVQKFNDHLTMVMAQARIIYDEQPLLTDKDYDVGLEVTDRNALHGQAPTINAMNIRLIHSFMGMFGEAGELLDALMSSMANGTPLDVTNIAEELGDCDWYKAVCCDELGLDEAQIRVANIEKLRKKRYKGGGFTAENAIVRDLEAERASLEQNLQLQT